MTLNNAVVFTTDRTKVVLNMLFDTETNETISTASMGSIASPQMESGSNKLPPSMGPMSGSIHNGPSFGHRGPTSMGNVMYEKKGTFCRRSSMTAGVTRVNSQSRRCWRR